MSRTPVRVWPTALDLLTCALFLPPQPVFAENSVTAAGVVADLVGGVA
jgi:hypothetical protein